MPQNGEPDMIESLTDMPFFLLQPTNFLTDSS